MARKYWWPGSMPEQLVSIQNFRSKIESYATRLGLTPAQVTAAVALCDAFIGAVNATEQCRLTMVAMTAWREAVLYGSPEGAPSPPAPVFPVVGATDYSNAVVSQFMRLRDLIVASPGYTLEIGEDLRIVGAENLPPSPANLRPEFKNVTVNGLTINVTGSMQGMDALRVEYSPKGGSFKTVAFLTNTPGGFQITPAAAGQPETGHIRAVYIKRNAEVGNFSADYPVTVS